LCSAAWLAGNWRGKKEVKLFILLQNWKEIVSNFLKIKESPQAVTSLVQCCMTSWKLVRVEGGRTIMGGPQAVTSLVQCCMASWKPAREEGGKTFHSSSELERNRLKFLED
jgi:hypothetical protein